MFLWDTGTASGTAQADEKTEVSTIRPSVPEDFRNLFARAYARTREKSSGTSGTLGRIGEVGHGVDA